MRVLVTGGTGYLGSAVVRALASRGHHPVVFARGASRAGLPGTPIDGDIRHVTALRGAAAGTDAIVHTAALVTIWRPQAVEFDDVNVGGIRNVLDVAGSLGIERIVYTSSFLALPPAGHQAALDANDYQRTKRDGRAVALDAIARGTKLAILYPGVVYGPGRSTEGNLVGRLLEDHLRGRLPGIVGASRLWSFAYVEDVAAAHVEAVERPEAIGEYSVGGENAPQMRMFEILREARGIRLPRQIPVALARAMGGMQELRARLTGAMPQVTRGAVEILSHDWPLDSTRSVHDLNYRITPLKSGMATTLNQL